MTPVRISAALFTTAAFLLSTCVSSPSPAQSALANQGICMPANAEDEAVLHALREQLLTPGTKVDLTQLPAPMLTRLQAMAKVEKEQQARDWANLCQYKAANAALIAENERPLIVLIGDSITENWPEASPAWFTSGKVGRGISGQTSSQMVLRFYGDVISLRPRMVHILAGTNDIGETAGVIGDDDYINNIRAMVDLALAHDIRPILGSILPVRRFQGKEITAPAERVERLNARLRELATERRIAFIDYHAALAGSDGGMRAGLSNDGVHPNRDAYQIMQPLLESAINDIEP